MACSAGASNQDLFLKSTCRLFRKAVASFKPKCSAPILLLAGREPAETFTIHVQLRQSP